VTIRSINPHDPSSVVFEIEPYGPDGVKQAVAHARAAFEEWSRLPVATRSSALNEIADGIQSRSGELVQAMIQEVGKPRTESRAEVARTVAIFRYYAQMTFGADGESFPSLDGTSWLIARRYPMGVCGLITPWNFPIAIPSWKLAPALAYGNTAVLKPAPEAAGITQTLTEIVSGHVPEGVLEVAHGDRETGEPLVEHPDVAIISFTGSVSVGRHVARAAAGRGAKVQCEMGGQNPAIVLGDADIESAAKTIAYAAMGYAGQKCTATSRVIVEANVFDRFREVFVSEVEAMEVVDPSSDTCQVGPLITADARRAALDSLGRAGGDVITGGTTLAGNGFYLAPTVVELEDLTSVLAKEEVFAPVTALMSAASAEIAIEMANDVDYGLVAGLYTRDIDRATALLGRIEAGLLRTNAPTTGVEYWAPFGGSKASSIGSREQGTAARDFYTETRTMLLSP
jgi:acyl-CoA reductase-like NAD-dependent aldehyde dehydrogenase